MLQPDLLLVLFQEGGLTHLTDAAGEWLQELLSGGLEEVGSVRWKEFEGFEADDGRSFELYFARGDLDRGTTSQGLDETLSSWVSQTTVLTMPL